jgi:subtilisin family serine protease
MVSSTPPIVEYWHLTPDEVASHLRVDGPHGRGIKGEGVRVVMLDSGFWRGHPYYWKSASDPSMNPRLRYNVQPTRVGLGETDKMGASVDHWTDFIPGLEFDPQRCPSCPGTSHGATPSGHGTALAALLLAVAPEVEFTMVKSKFVNWGEALQGILQWGDDERPHVISLSAYMPHDPQLPLSGGGHRNNHLKALSDAIEKAVNEYGITVVVAAGNNDDIGFPCFHPDVISAGGVYMREDESLHPSSSASHYTIDLRPVGLSEDTKLRDVPDVCGLVGQNYLTSPEHDKYIMLPVPPSTPKDANDQLQKGTIGMNWTYQNGYWPGLLPSTDRSDGTEQSEDLIQHSLFLTDVQKPATFSIPTDGWAAFSQTSAAAPQVAGVCALVLSACPGLSPADVKKVVTETATQRPCGPGSTPEPTNSKKRYLPGAGLVNASKAVDRAVGATGQIAGTISYGGARGNQLPDSSGT